MSRRRTYGHEIIKAIKLSRADMWVSLSDKHVYYVLRKLARDGLVSETEERAGNAPPRKVYEITDTGLAALRDMIRAEDLRTSFLPAPFDTVVGMIAYTDVLDPKESLALLRQRRDVLQARLAEEHPAEFAEVIESFYGYFARSLFEKSRAMLTAELSWIDDVIQRAEEADDWESLRVPKDFVEGDGF